MAMVFKKYPEIENSYQEGFVEKIKEAGYGDVVFSVFEKIHGANSQISYDTVSGEFAYGNRSAFLSEDAAFYNLQQVLEPVKPLVVELAKYLNRDLAAYGQRLNTVTVFGELFGGSYPHKDVPVDRNAVKVQKGVFYSPSNNWLAFDISYTVYGSDSSYFLCAHKFLNACSVCGIDHVPYLADVKGIDNALQYSDSMSSLVYRNYKLPRLDDNVMEGIVIRPFDYDVWLGNHRVILKKKNDKFKEKSRAKKATPPEDVPEIVKQARSEISQYITVNRVWNVISHIGEVGPKDIGRVIMETSKDVLKDYCKEYDTLTKMEKKDEKLVTKFMNDEVAKLVRDVVIYGFGM